MNKFWLIILCIVLVGCGTLKTLKTSTLNTNAWIGEPIRNSEIDTSGDLFFFRQLSDGTQIALYYDELTETDSGLVYITMMQNFGWSFNGDSWIGNSVYNRNTQLGYMYINLKKRMALHIDYSNEYKAYKIKILSRNIN